MKKTIPVDFEIGFADSKILSYSVRDDDVILLLECWNAQIVEICFIKFVSLFAMNYFRISVVHEIFESPFLERALNELYEEKPKKHGLRIFQFLNSDDMIALEVVCENIKIN